MANHSKKTKKLDLLKQQLRTSEDKLLILQNIAQQYIKHNDFKKALTYLNEALLQQEHPITYSLLANVYNKLSDMNTAISYYQKALTVMDSVPIEQEDILKIYFELGQAYQQIGHHYDAFYCYESVLKIDPEHFESFQLNLGIVGSIIKLLTEAWYVLVDVSNIPYPPVTNEIPERRFELNVSLPPNLSEYSDAEKDNFCVMFNQELGDALCRVNSMPELESFLSIFSKKEIKQLSYSHPQYFRAHGESWCIALKNILSTRPCKLTLRLFELPALLAGWNWKPEKEYFASERIAFKRIFHDPNTIPIIRCNARVLLFCFDAIEDSMQVALSAFVKDWAQNFTDRLCLAMTAPLWNSLFSSGWFNNIDDESLITLLMNHYANCLNSQNEKDSHLTWFLLKDLLGYSLHSEREWNRYVFEYLVLPVIKKSIQNKTYGLALSVAKLTSFSYAQQPHTDEQAELCWRAYLDYFLHAGRDITRNLSPLITQPQPVLKVGIIIDSVFNSCSPITVLFETFKDIYKLEHPISITIYAYNDIPNDNIFLIEKFKRIGVEVVDVSKLRDGLCPELDRASERLLTLRELMAEHAIQLAIYTHSSPAFIAFAAAIGLAPVQVSWTMAGYYALRLPEIQGYLTLGGTFETEKNYSGHTWKMLPGTLGGTNVHSKNPEYHSAQAHEIKSKFYKKYSVILGTIGRSQKIDSEEFLDTLAIILNNNPHAVFLWFGDKENSPVENKMKARGIYERCLFQGWVDPYVYARVLDIHLDSFPFGTGVALFTCMSAGTPSIFYYYPDDSIATTVANFYIYPVWSGVIGTKEQQNTVVQLFMDGSTGDSLFLYATNKVEYANCVQKLIEDIQLRQKVADAQKKFVSFMDEINIGEQFLQRIQEIIEESRR